jgi:hypothetical protein
MSRGVTRKLKCDVDHTTGGQKVNKVCKQTQPHRTTNIRGLNECDQPEGPRLMADNVIGEAHEKQPPPDTGFMIWIHTGKHTNYIKTHPTGLTAYNCNIIISHLINDRSWKDKTHQMPKELDPFINPVGLSPHSQEPANGRYFRS